MDVYSQQPDIKASFCCLLNSLQTPHYFILCGYIMDKTTDLKVLLHVMKSSKTIQEGVCKGVANS